MALALHRSTRIRRRCVAARRLLTVSPLSTSARVCDGSPRRRPASENRSVCVRGECCGKSRLIRSLLPFSGCRRCDGSRLGADQGKKKFDVLPDDRIGINPHEFRLAKVMIFFSKWNISERQGTWRRSSSSSCRRVCYRAATVLLDRRRRRSMLDRCSMDTAARGLLHLSRVTEE
jgi:hypothetical protein